MNEEQTIHPLHTDKGVYCQCPTCTVREFNVLNEQIRQVRNKVEQNLPPEDHKLLSELIELNIQIEQLCNQ